VILERNETRLARNEKRLERNETRLARNETRGGNLLLSGTVACVYKIIHLSYDRFVCRCVFHQTTFELLSFLHNTVLTELTKSLLNENQIAAAQQNMVSEV